MEPRTYVIAPEAAAHVTLRVEDFRETLSADDDLVEIGLWSSEGRGCGLSVAFSVAEIDELRRVLSEVIDRPE